jgi:hypothetical protein
MSRRRISQREAREAIKRVDELETLERNRRSRWAQSWFGGVHIASVIYEKDSVVPVAVRTARSLNHAVVAVGDETGTIKLMDLPHPDEDL